MRGGSLVFLFIFLISMTAWSAPNDDIYRLFPVLECPKVGEEFEQMISKLESVKSAIRKDANCRNVELQVKSLEDLVIKDRQEVMDIVGKSETESLSEDQARKVRSYAENVTKKVAALNDLFMRTNQCFAEDQADKQLSTLAGFVSEASGLVGSLTGPWGAPIAMAGNVVAGFLTGLDQVLKSRAGYDFSKREQWTGYVQNLCTYHSYRDQIDHLLNPQVKISQLKELKLKLELQISTLTQNCEECQSIENVFNAQVNRPSGEIQMMLSSEVQKADEHFRKPYGTYTLQSLGLREWTIKEIARVEKEAQTYWSDVSGRNLLYRAKEDIEKFLLEREAPRFLSFQTTQSRTDFNNFRMFLSEDGRTLYMRMESQFPNLIQNKVKYFGWSDPLEMFRAMIISPLDFTSLPRTEAAEDLKFSWDFFREQSLVRLRTAQTSTAVMQSFCSFFKHSGRYSPAIRAQCGSSMLRELVKTQSDLEAELNSAHVIPEAPAPLVINPEMDINYSMNKVESLIRALGVRRSFF